jgi:hypothetical protein
LLDGLPHRFGVSGNLSENPRDAVTADDPDFESFAHDVPLGGAMEPERPRGQPVIVIHVDIPLSIWIDIALKVTVAFLVAGVVVGLPLGIAAWFILSAT